MKIKILRDYSGEEGTDADKNVFAGSEHTVTRARGAELHAVGLAEILDDEGEDEAAAAEQAGAADAGATNGAGGEKQAQPVHSKPAPQRRKKVAAKPENKTQG